MILSELVVFTYYQLLFCSSDFCMLLGSRSAGISCRVDTQLLFGLYVNAGGNI